MRAFPSLAVPAALGLAALAAAGCDAGGKPADTTTMPRLAIVSPRMDQVIAVGDDGAVPAVHVMFDLQNYTVGKVEEGGDGQHVHLILDHEAYTAHYDVRKPIPLPAKLMTPGTHVVRAFPSAGPKDKKGALHHESRKNPGAFAWVRFHVGAPGGPLEAFDGSKPLLTFSRPKGEYVVGTPEHEKFLVDWYVTNATLSPAAYGVRATLNGAPLGDGVFRAWERYVLPTPPPVGEHRLGLTLVDANGDPVEGPFNAVEKPFTVVPKK